jgi:glycosyltransferase involved in cell wall biosynthesis
MIRGNIEAHFTKVIYNWVDTNKFQLRTIFNEKPANALVFSNYATKNNHYKIIEAACKRVGLPLDVLGEGMGNAVKNPEDIIGKYDLVFAKAKAAIEALATGAGVIVCDYAGFGDLVRPANFDYLRKFNFGRRTLTRTYEEAIILEAINKFNSADNRQNALTIRDQSSFDKIVEEIILLYKETVRNYADGKRGPKELILKTWLIAAALKSYYLFTTTILFKKLSVLKYKITNTVKHSF